MDPYEQKLKNLFKSHSKSGEQITQSELQALCVTLQLQKAPFLVHLLLENKQSCSFIEFRRGLLQVINEGISTSSKLIFSHPNCKTLNHLMVASKSCVVKVFIF